MSLVTDSEEGPSSHEESPSTTACTDDDHDAEHKIERSADGKTIEVKCGPLRAKMHVELFLCPGIHQPCIELNGEMVSPKEFTVRANKDKQKDWKGSIRIGKSNLRTLMELRTFDFYNHSHYCSAKCQSRNYITPKSERNLQEGNERRSSAKPIDTFNTPTTPYSALIKPDAHLIPMSSLNNNNVPTASNNNVDQMPDSRILPSNDDILHRLPPTSDNVGRAMHSGWLSLELKSLSDASTFWTQMQQIGILDDIVDSMLHEVDTVRNETRVHNITPRVCSTLSRLCSALDLTASVANRLRARQAPNFTPVIMATPTSSDRKRSLDESLLRSQLALMPDIKRPRTHYPPMMQTPLIEALLKVQSTYQLPQTPFSNVDLLLKFASVPPPIIPSELSSSSLLTPSLASLSAFQAPTTLFPSVPTPSATPLNEALLKIQ